MPQKKERETIFLISYLKLTPWHGSLEKSKPINQQTEPRESDVESETLSSTSKTSSNSWHRKVRLSKAFSSESVPLMLSAG